MKTRTITIMTLAVALLMAGTAFAQPGSGRGRGGPPDDGPGLLGPRLAGILELSDEQTAALDALREEHRAAAQENHKQILRLENELEGLMLADEPSEGDVVKLVRRIGELRTEQQVARAKGRLAMRGLLTEEQRDKLMMLKERRGGPRGSRGPGGRGGHRGDGRFAPPCDGDGPHGRADAECDGDGPHGRRRR